jgi:hypothetical protein
MNRAEFYSNKRAHLADLSEQFPEGCCLVHPVQGGGNTSEVDLDNAARLLTEGEFRLATAEEVDSYRAAMALRKANSTPVDGLQSARALFAALQRGDATR